MPQRIPKQKTRNCGCKRGKTAKIYKKNAKKQQRMKRRHRYR